MKIEEFVKGLKEQADKFEKHWKKEQAKKGLKDWPNEMEEGEWEEQFLAFSGLSEE